MAVCDFVVARKYFVLASLHCRDEMMKKIRIATPPID